MFKCDLPQYEFNDDSYMKLRNFSYRNHLNIYTITYRNISLSQIDNIKKYSYSHIELLNILETSFFNDVDKASELMNLVNLCHNNNLGVIININDKQYLDQDFILELISGFHIDGIVINDLSKIIYKNGNKDFGVDNTGVTFIQNFNRFIKENVNECILIGNNTGDYLSVTVDVKYGGLGFDYKCDLDGMNDTLDYYLMNQNDKSKNNNQLSYPLSYFYSDKLLLPLDINNFDLNKNEIKNLLLYYYTRPGKKINNIISYLDNDLFRYYLDLTHIYYFYKAFCSFDLETSTFKWIENNNEDCIFVYTRSDEDNCFVIVINMKNIIYKDYVFGVPMAGTYTELINSENVLYGGNIELNNGKYKTRKIKAHGLPNSITIDLMPYAAIIYAIPISRKAPVLDLPDTRQSVKTL